MEVPARGREAVVAIVTADDACTWVWWVNLGARNGMSRLCGAWDLYPAEPDWAKTLEALTHRRPLLATRRGRDALIKARITVSPEVDIPSTLTAMHAARDRVRTAFDEEQSGRSAASRMKEPVWPLFPGSFDIESPPPWDSRALKDGGYACLSIARWLAALCTRWEDFEEERLGRPLLRKLDGPPRVLPFAVVSA